MINGSMKKTHKGLRINQNRKMMIWRRGISVKYDECSVKRLQRKHIQIGVGRKVNKRCNLISISCLVKTSFMRVGTKAIYMNVPCHVTRNLF